MSYQFGQVERDERLDLAADEPLGEPARRGGLPTPILSAVVMAIFAGGLWFAYVQGTHHAAAPASNADTPAVVVPNAPNMPAAADKVPLIRADPQPIKTKPAQPGGMPVPDRDKLIYNEKPGGPPVEKLLPPAEEPVPRPAPAPSAAAPSDVLLPAGPPIRPLPAQPVRPAAPAKPGPGPGIAAKPAPSPAPPVGAIAGGHIRVQLASLRTPQEAWAEWQRLKREYPDLLGRLSADAVRADLGDRGIYYRILAGGFAQPAQAEHLCAELKQRRLGCSIVR